MTDAEITKSMRHALCTGRFNLASLVKRGEVDEPLHPPIRRGRAVVSIRRARTAAPPPLHRRMGLHIYERRGVGD